MDRQTLQSELVETLYTQEINRYLASEALKQIPADRRDEFVEHYKTNLLKRYQESVQKLFDFIDARDYKKLTDYLNTGNTNSRRAFEKYTGIELPSTMKGTNETLAEFVGSEKMAEHGRVLETQKIEHDVGHVKYVQDTVLSNLRRKQYRHQGRIIGAIEYLDTILKETIKIVITKTKSKDLHLYSANDVFYVFRKSDEKKYLLMKAKEQGIKIEQEGIMSNPGKKHLRGDIQRFKKIEQQTAQIGQTVQTMRREDERELKNPRDFDLNQIRIYQGWLHREKYGEKPIIDEDSPMTLKDFFKANEDGIFAEEQEEIRTQLKVNGYYISGGGAAAKWSIELLKPIPYENPQEGARALKKRLEALIEKNNAEYGTNFELSGAYGNTELWIDGNRLEAGSVRDCYEAFVRERFKDKWRKVNPRGQSIEKIIGSRHGYVVVIPEKRTVYPASGEPLYSPEKAAPIMRMLVKRGFKPIAVSQYDSFTLEDYDRIMNYEVKENPSAELPYGSFKITREGPIVESNTTQISVTDYLKTPADALRHISKADVKPDGWTTVVTDWEAKKFIFVWKNGKPIYVGNRPNPRQQRPVEVLTPFGTVRKMSLLEDGSIGLFDTRRNRWIVYFTSVEQAKQKNYRIKIEGGDYLNPLGPRGGATEVQSILFEKSRGWTIAKARDWAKRNGFKYGNVRETENEIRLQQEA